MLRRVCKLMGLNPASYTVADKKIMFDQGNTVPTDETAGYGVGCIFQHRDGGEGTALYVNEGSESECDFNAMATLTAAQEAALDAVTGTALDLGTSLTTRAIDVETTSASVDAGTSVRPIYMAHTATGAGSVGHRAEFHTLISAALGGWSNALKGYAEYDASGRTNGLGSAVCAELKLESGCTQGNYAPLEVEMVLGGSAALGTKSAMSYYNVTDDGTTFNTGGYFAILGDGIVDTANGMFDVISAAGFDACLKIYSASEGKDYFIGLAEDNAFA